VIFPLSHSSIGLERSSLLHYPHPVELCKSCPQICLPAWPWYHIWIDHTWWTLQSQALHMPCWAQSIGFMILHIPFLSGQIAPKNFMSRIGQSHPLECSTWKLYFSLHILPINWTNQIACNLSCNRGAVAFCRTKFCTMRNSSSCPASNPHKSWKTYPSWFVNTCSSLMLWLPRFKSRLVTNQHHIHRLLTDLSIGIEIDLIRGQDQK